MSIHFSGNILSQELAELKAWLRRIDERQTRIDKKLDRLAALLEQQKKEDSNE